MVHGYCDTTGTATGDYSGSTDSYSDLDYFFRSVNNSITELADIWDEIDISNYQYGLLLYKNWLTLKEWQRELYIKRVYTKLKVLSGITNIQLHRKTCHSTTPIRRNRPKTRS